MHRGSHERSSQKGQRLSIFPPITALQAVRQCVRCCLPGLAHRLRRLRRVPERFWLLRKQTYQHRCLQGCRPALRRSGGRME
nr:MAG TPA: hypothetical protein [Caudoviricetes sp.]